MSKAPRKMRLTPKLVARCYRVVEDSGPLPGLPYLEEHEFAIEAQRLFSEKPPGPLYLFAYGSLIWKPEFPHVEMLRAKAHGWHRAFSMRIERYRATREQHGYMMCLDRGGVCEGVALRLPDEDQPALLEKLLRRELSRRAGLSGVRWIDVEQGTETIKALAFYAYPHELDNYLEHRPLEDVASALALACGHWGSGADYLYNTVHHLEQMGIHNEALWRLQEMVAEEIELQTSENYIPGIR
jgi:glutathione-specific gamma-glutamylcyclotransferase